VALKDKIAIKTGRTLFSAENVCARFLSIAILRLMPTDSIPKFTAAAAKLWATIPGDSKKLLLSNVWCGKCSHAITIIDFSGTVKAGDLLLVGKCSECHGDVARLIELKGRAGSARRTQ
jgi:hypothetical protein